MNAYNITAEEIKKVKSAISAGIAGRIPWQAVCARPDLARRLIAKHAEINRFLNQSTAISRKGGIMDKLSRGANQ